MFLKKIIILNFIFLVFISNQAISNELKKIENTTPKTDENILTKKSTKDTNLADNQHNLKSKIFIKGLTTSIAIEKARGISQENVYLNNKKISELNWKFRDVKMLRLNLGFEVEEHIKINASYAGSFRNSSKSYMTDYDWLGSPGGDDGNVNHNAWTHYSYSLTDTKIEEFDINTSSDFLKFIDVNLGYREHRFKFSDSLQNISYSCTQEDFNNNRCSQVGLRNINQQFNGFNAVNYYQKFRIPYIGASFKYGFFNDKLKFSIYGAFSNIVSAYSKDHHIARSFTITGKFHNGKYYNFGSNVNYKFYKDLALSLGFDYFEIPEMRGDSYYDYYNQNIRFINSKGAGISNKTQRVSLGLKYDFNI